MLLCYESGAPQVEPRASSRNRWRAISMRRIHLNEPRGRTNTDGYTLSYEYRGSRNCHLRRDLGRGRLTAIVLLVTKDDEEVGLKLASNPEHNDRLRDEATLLRKLQHQNIVTVLDDVEINGLLGFATKGAGDKTFGQRLRSEGWLRLELLERFGEELIETVGHLKWVGI